jgi:hypothetical protein
MEDRLNRLEEQVTLKSVEQPYFYDNESQLSPAD